MPVKVAVNGYGTIGKRLADAIAKLPDFKLIGVAKYNADYSALLIVKRGIDIYVPKEKHREFRDIGVEPAGSIEDMVEAAELVYDASPAKQGLRNKELYTKYRKPAVFQGGEPPEVAELSYSTLCNYDKALGRTYVRVVSCNTTGLLRVICSIGIDSVDSVFGVIVRRASDPKEDLRGPVNSVLLESPFLPSHHSKDVASVIGDKPPIITVSLVVPSTIMHVQVLNIRLKKRINVENLIELLDRSGRIVPLSSKQLKIDSTGKLVELSRDLGRPRYDIYENILFSDSLYVNNDGVVMIQAVHQEAIVIPENLDVAYAIMNLETDVQRVVEKVNKALGIGSLQAIISGNTIRS
ncbi:MAG: type II glyceraldehyde-3-phosphate dehydrogenase [Desulfurococcaceae archaeon]